MKLQDLADLCYVRIGGSPGIATISLSNLDDFFREFNKLGIEEVEVNRYQMLMIVQWYLGNVGNDKDGNQGKIIREGKIDEFLGVKLILSS